MNESDKKALCFFLGIDDFKIIIKGFKTDIFPAYLYVFSCENLTKLLFFLIRILHGNIEKNQK